MNAAKTSVIEKNMGIGILPVLYFLLALVYFLVFGNYVLYFQETQGLFIFSGDYLHGFLLKPGGLTEYAAKFLTQFYPLKLAGSLIAAVFLTLPALILYFINRRILSRTTFSGFLALVPSSLLLLMQANYYHLMEYNLGFIFILLLMLPVTARGRKLFLYLILALTPLIYYIIGAYFWILILLLCTYLLTMETGRWRFAFLGIMLTYTALVFLVFWKLIFLQPVQQLLLSPLPLLENPYYKATFVFLSAYLVFYPVICSSISRSKKLWLRKNSPPLVSSVLLCSIIVFSLFRIYNPQTASVIETERRVFAWKWDKAVEFHTRKPTRNLIGEYFYNLSLAETDQLCDRLFFSPQDFGTGSLVLPWGDDHLNRGAYFYYVIGLSNEAHRWAYEEMVVFGFRPQNLQILAKTSLINGDYMMARKYCNILKKTLLYRKWAMKYGKMADDPGLLKEDSEMLGKIEILPKNDFFIQFNEPQNNIALMLDSQRDNRKALEYYFAGLLLTKSVEIIVNNIKLLKDAGYTHLPRHIEEAILAYYNSTKIVPDLAGFTISQETRDRFDRYFSAYLRARQKPATFQAEMQKDYATTFWYYFHFR